MINAVYPRICPVCNRIVTPFGADICPGCETLLSFVEDDHCMICGKPVDVTQEYCSDCVKRAHIYDEGRGVLVYDEYSSKSIYRFKYNNKREFASYYGRIMHEHLGRKIKYWDPEVLIPVPVHVSRLKKRGYNQAELMARELSKRCGIALRSDIVERDRGTHVQKRLSAAERQNNLKKAFKVVKNDVQYDSVLIIDDIYTTGATIDAMAACLKTAGVKKVYFATLCIGRGI